METSIVVVDLLGLEYDGDTVKHRGLGGSESAIIYMARELTKIGFNVDVVCNNPNGITTVDNVQYIDHSFHHVLDRTYDVFISSRSVEPFRSNNKYAALAMNCNHRVVWLHDTFCEGEQDLEAMVVQGFIHEIFTLSDWHTNYVLNSQHGPARNFDMLKNHVFQTRNGVMQHIPFVVPTAKDLNHFVYNASATKGLEPLLKEVWPLIKEQLPRARLTCIGGFYQLKDGHKDEQQKTVEQYASNEALKALDVTFTGVINQKQIAEIYANAYMTVYPTAFPETFGISTLESLMYNTPVVTCRFGALEETAFEDACYKLPYSATPNYLKPDINSKEQARAFVNLVMQAYHNPRLFKQKQQACNAIKKWVTWDTVALQWKQHIFKKLGKYLSVNEFETVSRINQNVSRLFGRRFSDPTVVAPFVSNFRTTKFIVVSPFYNAAPYLNDHIESVATQCYANFHHVMIDDCSTDISTEIVSKAHRVRLIRNTHRVGALANQIHIMNQYTDNVVFMLLDGDDCLVPDNTIFQMYDDLYQQGYDMTYGSMWSVADKMPLIAQQYVPEKLFREQLFEWQIPYTHLRTFRASIFDKINLDKLKTPDGKFMKAGGDNPLFYELIENAENPLAVQQIVVRYNDINPLCDFRVNSEEQTRNARTSYA
jgi:glycosyltransferase involved in cell wall biosynthesis